MSGLIRNLPGIKPNSFIYRSARIHGCGKLLSGYCLSLLFKAQVHGLQYAGWLFYASAQFLSTTAKPLASRFT